LLLKIMFSPSLGPIRLLYIVEFRPIGNESLTFYQNSQLELEMVQFIVFVKINYVIPLSALENQIFTPFRPYFTLIRPSSGQSVLKV